MNIRINLLADKDKEERKLEETLGVILRTGLSLIFTLFILFGILNAIEMVLHIEFDSAQKEMKTHPSESMDDIIAAEGLLKDANAISTKISTTAKQVPYWSKILEKLSNDVPDGMQINNIHIEKEHLKIIGFAKTREAFLMFQDKLRGGTYKNLVSPISNLVSPDNLEFTVEVDVDKNFLYQP
jgi:Tfp pilus assembly protein PilN